MESADPYEILGVPKGATKEEIKRAYRRLSVRVHSDAGGTDALFRQVQWAYETLLSRVDDSRNVNHENETRTEDQTQRPPYSENHWDETRTEDQTQRPSYNAHQSTTPLASSNWISRHPSWAIFIGGLLLLSVTSELGPNIQVFGLLVAVLGLAGITGVKRARASENLRRANIGVVDQMTGQQFEGFLVTLFEAEGFGVKHIGKRGDFGADLILMSGEARTVVQAKRWTGSVGPGAVQEVAAARAHYRAQKSIVITNSSYTVAAKKLAKSNDVDLLDRSDLVNMIAKQSMVPAKMGWARYRIELREGLPLLVKRVLLAVFLLLGALAAATNSSSRTRRRRRR